jgi:hypothetical protein
LVTHDSAWLTARRERHRPGNQDEEAAELCPSRPVTSEFVNTNLSVGVLPSALTHNRRSTPRTEPHDSLRLTRSHHAAPAGCRVAALSRFQTLIAAIDNSSDESSFSS